MHTATKMKKQRKSIKKEIEIPSGVELKLELPKVEITGSLGSNERVFALGKKTEIKQENNKIVVECANATKNEKKMANTIAAHIKNMVEGVTNGFEYKLQICSTHFPMTVGVENGALSIKNFLGETKSRIVKLRSGVDVLIKDDIITVKGINIENVAQCAADIERATRITDKDRRVFEDGIFIISKAGEKI